MDGLAGMSRQYEPNRDTLRRMQEALCVVHTFHLRRDLCVPLRLPVDLTAAEAERLCQMIRTLPLK